MNKRFLIIAVAGLAVAGLAILLLNEYTDPKHDQRPGFTEAELVEASRKHFGEAPSSAPAPVAIDLARPVRLAIGRIGMTNEETDRQTSDLLLAQLTGARGLELIERQSLDKVLDEIQMSLAQLVRAKDAIRVGKLVRADWFLLGTPLTANGSNSIVIRVVDARTGVLREAGVFNADLGASQLASHLAAFVRHCRQNAAEARSPVYLAIGSFEDLSLNSRQATLPGQLRSYLTAAYQGANVTLLEREFANTLLQELRLDLAGLTEEAEANAPTMQSAYWLVDGFYQSYESTELQVELFLKVQRMFGRSQRFELREKPGEPLFKRVKASVDEVMNRDRDVLRFTRMTETRAQLQAGQELADLGNAGHVLEHVWVGYDGYRNISENEMARRVRNAEEAVRAFETVLLLDPTNREARICLATCFRKTLIRRMDEARDYYRHVIDSPISDQWSDIARQALLRSFEWSDVDSRRQWFEQAAQSTANLAAAEFYQANAKRAAEDATIQRRGTTKAEELAEVRLFENIQSFDNLIHGKSGKGSFAVGMDDFAEVFGEDRALAARRLVDLFPKMKARFPDAAPYLLATITTFQVDTNAPIITEFERTLEWCAEHPDKVVNGGMTFWNHVRYEPYEWALKHKLPSLAVKILESIFRAAAADPKARSVIRGEEDKMALAYGYIATERWKDALAVFESYTNQPVHMGGSGPWGRAFTVVLTSKQAAMCRKKLGLPPVIDPREFDLGEPCLHPHGPNSYYDTVTFATAADGLWIGLNDHVINVSFNLETNSIARLSSSSSAPASAIRVGESNVWIGTAGGGLFELNKSTKKIQHFTEKDGLLMDHISALDLAGNTLWIGYGNESGGGLGRFDLNTRRFISFTASLTDADSPKPPRERVAEIRTSPAGDVWFIARSSMSRFQPVEGRWEYLPNKRGMFVKSFALDGDRLVEALEVGQVQLTIETKTSGTTNAPLVTNRFVTYEESDRLQAVLRTNRSSGQRIKGISSGSNPAKGGLGLRTLRGSSEYAVVGTEELPKPPTALALQGRDLWVGGLGYVALVDLESNKLKKFAYVPARSVDRIQIGGGWLWVQFDKHIYRVSLRDVH